MRTLSSTLETVEKRMAQMGHHPALTAVPELYAVLGPEQRELWDRAERDLEEAAAGKCQMLLAVSAEQYELIMGELIDYAARKVRHARIQRTLREDCWSAREEG